MPAQKKGIKEAKKEQLTATAGGERKKQKRREKERYARFKTGQIHGCPERRVM